MNSTERSEKVLIDDTMYRVSRATHPVSSSVTQDRWRGSRARASVGEGEECQQIGNTRKKIINTREKIMRFHTYVTMLHKCGLALFIPPHYFAIIRFESQRGVTARCDNQ